MIDNKKTTLQNLASSELELELLGAIVSEGMKSFEIAASLDADCFTEDKAQKIWGIISEFVMVGNDFTMFDVSAKARGIEGIDGNDIVNITNMYSGNLSSAMLKRKALRLRELKQQRKAVEIFNDSLTEMMNPNIDLPAVYERLINFVSESYDDMGTKRLGASMKEIIAERRDQYEKALKYEVGLSGIPTHIELLNQIMGGFQAPDVTVLAANTSMGKTDFALEICRTATKAGFKSAFISMEMGAGQILDRLVCMEMGIAKRDLKLIPVPFEIHQKKIKGLEVIEASGMTILDTGGITLHQLSTKMRFLKEQGVELVVIDYLGLMNYKLGNGENTAQAVGKLAKGIQNLAKEHDMAVLLLHQLSRANVTRGGDMKPRLSDLRNSGEIEEAVANIWFLYRPEYFGFETDENGESTADKLKVIIAKNRHGQRNVEVDCYYFPAYGKYHNMDYEDTVLASSYRK